MPKRNRVAPLPNGGRIVAVAARGTLMGNRGCLHDASGNIVRDFALTRWLTCRLEFRGRRRTILSPGKYTELFFLDEATSFAVGHRPCGECRREDLKRFRQFWPHPGSTLAEIDATLHRERMQEPIPVADPASLPDGTMLIAPDRSAVVLHARGRLHQWTFDGYKPFQFDFNSWQILTPPSIVRVLAAGYPAGLHASLPLTLTERAELREEPG
jgi:hypothetical protein